MRLYDDKELYAALKELDVIDQKTLDDSVNIARIRKEPLADIILDKELLSDDNLGQVIADLAGFPFISLDETPIDDETLLIIPQTMARAQRIIAFKKTDQFIHIASDNPANYKPIRQVEKKTGLDAKIYFATKKDIAQALALYNKDIERAFKAVIEESSKKTGPSDPPIIKIVDTIFEHAYQNNTSDIHIEPLEKESLIRFRIDGILHDIVRFPISIHPRVVTRIKVMARLRTDEHQAAQDGKIRFKVQDEDLDIRVSVVPVTEGEKIVMRLLSERSRQFSLKDLGFSDPDLKKLEPAYQKPHGMILVTGPTGSGKTTTLYAVLKILNKRGINIMTIEDPVEYDIEGVNQIQVNTKTNLTFAAGLRSIVRQDPDIVLVGEIRDEETADIAINAAMTGHLVLSTLHTNDAPTAFPRLLDMQVEPFLVSSTVNVVVAQRLVRKICNTCRVSTNISRDQLTSTLSPKTVTKHFKNKKTIRVYQGKGCNVCHGTTYTGRVGIFEVLLIDEDMRNAIINRYDSAKIREIAVKNGMSTMLDDGLQKVSAGITTVEEVLRVTRE